MRTFKKKRKQEFSIQPKWPEEISQHCPKCKRKLDIRSDLESGSGPIGRFIRKYSFASFTSTRFVSSYWERQTHSP